MRPEVNQANDMVDLGQDRWTPEIRQTVGLVQSQLTQLLQQRSAVVKRIAMIRRAIEGLNAIFGDPESGQSEIGGENVRFQNPTSSSLTEACRLVLRNSTRPLTARETAALLRSRQAIDKEHLERRVALICRRLVVYGEATVTMTDSGRKAWAWRLDGGSLSPEQSHQVPI
jgi:chorismate mutase